MINIVPLKRSIRCKIQAIFGGDGSDRPGLLISGNNFIYGFEIRRSTQDPALASVIASENPKTIVPFVIDDVVHMPNRAFRKSVRDLPFIAAVHGHINMGFITASVVEIFSPERAAIGSAGDRKWPRTTQET